MLHQNLGALGTDLFLMNIFHTLKIVVPLGPSLETIYYPSDRPLSCKSRRGESLDSNLAAESTDYPREIEREDHLKLTE